MTDQPITPQWPPANEALESLRALVNEHIEDAPDEPIVLAAAFATPERPGELVLLEVIENFGGNEVDRDRRILEAAFDPGSFPWTLRLGFDRTVRMLLTNPREFAEALQRHWPQAEMLRQALAAHRYCILHVDPNQPHYGDLVTVGAPFVVHGAA